MELLHDQNYMRGWDGTDVVADKQATLPRRATEHDLNQASAGNPHPHQRRSRRFPRLLYKDGAYTLIPQNIPNWLSRFATDFWNTLLDMKWISILLFFLVSNVTVWLIFTGIFYVISYIHGDFQAENMGNLEWNPCIEFGNGNTSFAGVFLFSVETLRTIGYGAQYPTEECPATVFFLCFSCIVSVLLESVLVGLLLAKTHVPQKRNQTLMFSKCATICTRDNQMCLLFRIGNVRTSLLLRIVLKAYLVYAKRTEEGEEMPFHQHEIDLQIDSNGDNVYLAHPITAIHVIDRSSPFYHLSKKNLERAAFELIVILEGIVESTGASIQARTSYVPREIFWGHRFQNMYVPPNQAKSQHFDFSFFDQIVFQPNLWDHSAFEMEHLTDLRRISPEIIISGSYSDMVDMHDGPGPFEEATLSPSLARALDISYEEIDYRNRAVSAYRGENSRSHFLGANGMASRRPSMTGHFRDGAAGNRTYSGSRPSSYYYAPVKEGLKEGNRYSSRMVASSLPLSSTSRGGTPLISAGPSGRLRHRTYSDP